ncbi:T9SS type A sorting domain-containing protein [Psychroflexus maritimus]|uniref:T9SS type A sorting domain-containing protein n=1 Tax=Psychroflexus maritimus TaxID=2714865 RepID=A0A967AFP8_9FLAO|nr:T9SS type A sorting domain-containing protein [Psychroflexus maritimus]NGZ89656.1 T9SS type A sorting domain-containing protein [Psychroflexus maritimus]
MKNQFNIITLFLLINLILSNHTNAQYESIFGEESTRMQLLIIDNMPVEFTTSFDGFYSNNTIMVEDTIYHEFVWFTKINNDEWTEMALVYYLREDLENGKVWLLPPASLNTPPTSKEDEVLVVDMSLEIGDEFTYFRDPVEDQSLTETITVVDVYSENDKKHIVFDREFDPSFGQGLEGWETQSLMFVEGLGSTYGYFHLYQYALLTCIEKDDLIHESIYQPLADLCETDTFSSPNEEFTNTSLYPNPAITYFQVNYPSEIGTSELKIFNLQGKLILQKPSYQQESLDVTNFSSGVYFVELTSREGEIWRKKLIKE